MEIKYYIIIACFGLAILLSFKEIKRLDKARLVWRLLANFVVLVCFALLIIPIHYTVKRESPAEELNFFTEKINPFVDLNYHLKIHPEINKINIYGYGLNNHELKKLSNYQLSFHPSVIPSGFLSASWQKKLKAAEQLTLQGSYQNATNSDVKLKLVGFGTALDSVIVKANTKINFSFVNRPKLIGKAVFSLLALQGSDTLSAEPVPFKVEQKEPIRVLILSSFPDFEYKFLKKWLAENQFQVAFRSQISKDKFNTEFLNRKAINLGKINQALLKDIDVAVIEETEVNNGLLDAVKTGMGLIVRTKNIKPSQNHQPLLTDTTGKISVDSRLNGMGKIISTTIMSTYQWQLAGKQVEYGNYWTSLFEKALRKRIKNYSYMVDTQWPTVDEKARIIVDLPDNKAPQIAINSINIAPRQNIELPFEWDGFFWPKTAGWQNLSINQQTENLYIYKKSDWMTAKNFEKLRATENFIANQKKGTTKSTKISHTVTKELGKWWVFIGFLLGISFLWYEQRFLENK